VHGAPVFINEKANTGEGTGLTVWDGVRACVYVSEGEGSCL